MTIQRGRVGLALLVVLTASLALGLSLWDRDYPGNVVTWWQGERVYAYLRWRLAAYIAISLVLGLGCWALGVWGRIRGGASPSTTLWQQTLPYALWLLTPLIVVRYVWSPLGMTPGSSFWTYVLIPPIALVVAASLAPWIPPGGLLYHRHPRALWVLIGLFIVTFGALAFARHLSFKSHALDLGTMAQAAWNTGQGRWLEYTPLFEEYVPAPPLSNRLVSGKMELVFLPLGLLYRFIPSPLVLLAVQTLALGLSAWPLYHVLYLTLRSYHATLFLTAAYLAYLPLHYVAMADFHPSALIPFFLNWALYFLFTKRYRAYVMSLLGAFACRVDAALVALGLGALLLYQRKWRVGAVTLALALGWIVLDFYVVVPWAQARYGPDPVGLIEQRFGRYGETPVEILLGLLARPQDLVRLLTEREKVQTAFDLLMPLGGLPVFALLWLLPAMPLTALNLLADSPWQGTVRAHYFAPVLPIFFVAAAMGLRWLHARIAYWRPPDRRLWSSGLALYMLASTLLVNYYFSPFPLGRDFRLGTFWSWSPHHDAIRRVLAQVSPDSRLSAQSDLLPHVAHRRFLYLFPSGDQVADEILLDLDFAAEHAPLDFYAFYETVERVINDPRFGLKAWDNGVLLLARGYPHDPEKVRQLRVAYDAGFYRVQWLGYEGPREMVVDEMYPVRVCVRNTGTQGWKSTGWHPTKLSYHWLDLEGNVVVWDGERTSFHVIVYPQQRRCVEALVLAPSRPGTYVLQFDLVREQIAWFSQKGAETLDIQITVRPRE